MKIRIIYFTTTIIIMFALFVMAFVYGKNARGRLLYVEPNSKGVFGAGVDSVDEVNENNFMLTYECSLESTAKALEKNYSIKLIGTNYCYPYVMGYGMANGGFFTYDMQRHGDSSAVLNKKAAFDMFGGYDIVGREITINGGKYVIQGVVDDSSGNSDEYEELRIFIPASQLNRQITVLICPLNETGGVSSEYVKNELKYIGITEDRYTFTDSGLMYMLLLNNGIASVYVLALVVGLSSLIRLIRYIYAGLAAVKREMERVYFRQFIHDNSRLCFKITFAAFGAAACFLIIAAALVGLLEEYLLWHEMFEAYAGSAAFIVSNALLALFIMLCALYPFIKQVLNTLHNAELSVQK